jgi:hypothetical protein
MRDADENRDITRWAYLYGHTDCCYSSEIGEDGTFFFTNCVRDHSLAMLKLLYGYHLALEAGASIFFSGK